MMRFLLLLLTLLLTLLPTANAQHQDVLPDEARWQTQPERPDYPERVERYTYDPETGAPTLTPDSEAIYFERHAERRTAARAEAARRAGEVDGVPPSASPSASPPEGEGQRTAFTFTVTTAFDSGDTNPGDGVCQASGFLTGCTLRAAIEEANATPSALRVTIEFDIGFGPGGSDLGGGAWRIQPSSALPTITRENTTLDALTQSGAECGGLIGGVFQVPHTLKVVLSGSLLTASATGLDASPLAGNIDIRGFAVQDFPGYGIAVGGAGSEVACNYVGTNRGGTAAAPNADGIYVGGDFLLQGTVVVENNLVSGNYSDFNTRAITVLRNDAEVRGNLLGTDATGNAPLAVGEDIQGYGVFVSGDDVVVDGNVASGNHSGIVLSASVGSFGQVRRAERAQVTNNYVGLSRRGLALSPDLGNEFRGIGVGDGATNNDIGLPGAGNVIGYSEDYGILVTALGGTGTANNRVLGNTVGLDVNGTVAPNRLWGVYIDGALNTTIRGNTISGNYIYGLSIENGSSGTVVEDNRIGTDPTGTLGRPNSTGIYGLGTDTIIRGNTISGNDNNGITDSIGDSNVVIEDNFIGTNAAGDDLGNGGIGVFCRQTTGLRVGKNFSPNTIAFNESAGVYALFESCRELSIVGNYIYANGGLGVDLGGDGPTANDPGDGDTGPNGLQNYPVIASAENNGANSVVTWTLDSTPNTTFELLFCRLDEADPTGYGECEDPNALATVTTDAQGRAAGTLTRGPALYPAGDWVTVNATVVEDPLPAGYGATSEFSLAVRVEDTSTPPGVDLTATNTSPLTVAPGGQVSFDYAVENTTASAATGDLFFRAERNGNTVAQGVVVSGTVQAGQTVTGSFVQQVPQSAPAGQYDYSLRIGQFPSVTTGVVSFAATVTGSARPGGAATWSAVEAAPWTPTSRSGEMEAASREASLPAEATLSGAYPNPSRGRATVAFTLPTPQRVRIVVYDVLGRAVAVLVDDDFEAGRHEAVLDGRGLPAGVYLVRLEAGGVVQTQHLTLVR